MSVSEKVDVFPFSFLLHDWRLATPTSLDACRSIITGKFAETVPIIRLYGYSCPLGSSNRAESCVVNVHRYFPKLFMDALPGISLPELAELIDSKLGACSVYNITAMERMNFYGYHESPHSVLAVELFRPLDVAKLAELVTTSCFFLEIRCEEKTQIKVYEVHIPYTLQFLVEHGIQGVTPFWIDPKQIIPTFPKTTCVNLEISIYPHSVILNKRGSSQAGRDYPVPSPLTTAAGSSSSPEDEDLVCEVLQSLWEEEYLRTAPGEAFPYEPEGIIDGINRPDCAEMPWTVARKPAVSSFEENPKEELADVSGSLDSAVLAEGLENLHSRNDGTMVSTGDEPITPTAVLPPCISETLKQTESCLEETLRQTEAPLIVDTVRQQTEKDSSPFVEDRTEEPTGTAQTVSSSCVFLPNSECVIKFSAPAPRPSVISASSLSFSASMSGSQTQFLSSGPQRLGKPVPTTQGLAPSMSQLTFMTMIVVEILTDTDRVVADASKDAVLSVVFKLIDERSVNERNESVVVFFWGGRNMHVGPNCEFHHCESEPEMIMKIQKIIFQQFDPHVVLSWDCSRSSMGYLSDRVQALNLEGFSPSFGRSYSSALASSGRLFVDLWRVLRNDAESGLKLGTTSLEGVALSVLGKTFPALPDHVMRNRFDRLSKLIEKVEIVNAIQETTRVMPRATEMARLYGMDLESTFTRGSQFRVECMLVRASRKSGYLLPSSSKTQVKNQTATEGIPLVLEPVSGFITDPVCVFDFQSLYPSLIIAYNMCFSTCLGRRSGNQLGTQGIYSRPEDGRLEHIFVPSDVGFVKRSERLGLLPRICHEILQTRLMVKKAMKSNNKSEALLKQLDARQLSLKLLANVIYGYTTASFSGRMPCAEIADAIVLTGRESLEHVMRLAESMGGKIVYGDTDSLFVKLEGGQTVEQAFEFGKKLVEKVAQTFPWPMKLIHEKVYWPCCLVTKKRYVGRAFDTVDAPPRLDAKGIETIRRDTCPAVAVTVERIINEMFDITTDDDPVKILGKLEAVCIKEFSRILKGALPRKFFVFQNQVRNIADYKDMNHLPPAARVAVDSGRTDAAKGERIAYVITQGEIGSKLSQQVKPPSALSGNAQLNLEYYVTKQVIPAVQRIFGPLANRAYTWLSHSRVAKHISTPSLTVVKTCLLCSAPTASSLFKASKNVPLFCSLCMQSRTAQSIATAGKYLSNAEKKICDLRKLCLHCAGSAADACTDAYHCEVYFQRIRASNIDKSKYLCSGSSW